MEGGERVTLSNSFGWKKSVNTFSILVVDDDTTCLSIVAAILKKFKYEVVTVKHPNDALYTLRIKGGAFDLVVSDVHMPDMNGFELQQAIAQEFNLPVVLMSADDKEGVALKGLESGAAYFILKPVSSDDLRDLWQFAAMKKKSQVDIEEKTGSFPQGKTTNVSDEIVVSATSVNEDTANKKDSKGKSPRKEGSSDEKNGENSQSASQKRPKLIWTNSLHNRFLEAIRSIGLDRAVPKKILEVMNVPGLTRENVASHLQKYRIFLRRVSDASYKIQYSTDKGLSQNLKSSSESSGITSPSSTLKLNKFNKLNYQNSEKFPVDAHNAALPNVEPSSSSLITQSGFGQSRLLSNRGSWLKPNIGNTNLMIHQNDSSCARLAQKNYQTRPQIQGHLANVSLEDLSSALSAGFDTFPSYDVPSQKNVGTSDIISSSPSKIFTYQTNYVGYSISSIKQLTTPGHSEKYDGSKSCAGIINLPSDEVQNNSTLQAALTIPHDNNILDRLAQPVGASNSIAADNNGGEQLSDVIGDYTMLLSSNLPFVSGAENGGKINEFAFSPIFDMSESDMLSIQHLEESVFGTTLVDQLNFQTQAQQTGGDTTTNSNFDGNVSHWVNHIPSFDRAPNQQQVYQGLTNSIEFGTSSQLSKTLLPHTERDDDDFLESLLAPFVEDQTLEGI